MDKTTTDLPAAHYPLFGSDANKLLGIGEKFTYIVYSRYNFSDALPGFRAALFPSEGRSFTP